MVRGWRRSIIGAAVAGLLVACGGSDAPPPGVPPEDLVGGREARVFYARNCSACHGLEREGRIGPALTPDRLTQERAFYAATIALGRPGTAMPGWGAQTINGGLSEQEVTRLLEWLLEEASNQ
ncbi:MAG: cytochrome c [Dehalococcoidia bacterium]|nr:cytochrome c [Dehalococcoidia bacterium]